MTLVSVVIATHNRTALLLERSLPSVLRQTHAELDVIVVGDETEQATVDAMAALTDPRVRFWNLPRQQYPEDPGARWGVLGLEARNFGMDQALGEYIAPLDDDDEWTDDHVELLLREVQQAGVDVAYGRSIAHRADGSVGFYGNWPPRHFQYCSGAELIATKLGYRFDPDCLKRGLPEDGDMIDRMVADGVRFTFLDRIIHTYYPNPR